MKMGTRYGMGKRLLLAMALSSFLEEKPLYLDMAPGFLKPLTMGYGIWTYRDYGDNKVFNSQFAWERRAGSFPGTAV